MTQAGWAVQLPSVDPEARRISLSLRAALPKEPVAAAEEEEETSEAPPPKASKTPLRGGVGNQRFLIETDLGETAG